jgi:hypothetical protein
VRSSPGAVRGINDAMEHLSIKSELYYALYFLVLLVTKGVGWSMNLWMGSIVMAGIVGLLVSYLLVPPLIHEIM